MSLSQPPRAVLNRPVSAFDVYGQFVIVDDAVLIALGLAAVYTGATLVGAAIGETISNVLSKRADAEDQNDDAFDRDSKKPPTTKKIIRSLMKTPTMISIA